MTSRRPNTERLHSQSWDGMVVIASGVSWDDTWLVEKHLAIQMARHAPVLFVDPPMSWLTPLKKPQLARESSEPRLRLVQHNLARLTPLAPPGISRPIIRDVALRATKFAIRRAVRHLNGQVRALVVCSLDPLLDACPADLRVLYGTDDWVSGASLMGISEKWLISRENDQLRRADVVVAVSPELAERWSSRAGSVTVISNGCDADLFGRTGTTAAAPDVVLPAPIAGFFGHLSERIDIDLLTAVAHTGQSLLLVGGRQLTFAMDSMESLLALPNVQWLGPRPFQDLPAYMATIKVGLTPYSRSDFNQSSFPLKTLEYLAAGRAVVASDLPAARSLPTDLVAIGGGPAEFASETVQALQAPDDQKLIQKRMAFAAAHSWQQRGNELAALLRL